MSNLQEFKDNLAKTLYGMTAKEAIEKEICLKCKKPWQLNTRTLGGSREYAISGLCEKCFNQICAEVYNENRPKGL